MQDVQIGRAANGIPTIVSVSNTAATMLVGTDPDRIALVVSQPSADGIRFFPRLTPTATLGIALLSTTDKPFQADLGHYGQVLGLAWFAIATGAAPVDVAVLSVSLAARAASELPIPGARPR